jgi:hypothetical protein
LSHANLLDACGREGNPFALNTSSAGAAKSKRAVGRAAPAAARSLQIPSGEKDDGQASHISFGGVIVGLRNVILTAVFAFRGYAVFLQLPFGVNPMATKTLKPEQLVDLSVR